MIVTVGSSQFVQSMNNNQSKFYSRLISSLADQGSKVVSSVHDEWGVRVLVQDCDGFWWTYSIFYSGYMFLNNSFPLACEMDDWKCPACPF